MRLLTKSGGILGPIATVLGFVMSGIFAILVALNIPNIGLAIILFTIVIYMLMLPLTYRQQKFSRMTPLMNPELNAVREKYKGKNDQASMQRMNEETKQVYAKYGVNPAGSCVQLVIQMLILFPLYRVIMNVPAYVPQVKEVFMKLAEALLKVSGAEKYLTEIGSSIQATTISKEFTLNTIIDTLYKFRPANWDALAQKFPELKDLISSTATTIGKMNSFLGLDISNTPMNYIKAHESAFLVIGAILVPVLAAATQWLSVKVSMAGNPQSAGSDQMAGTMKTMNNIMPLMSAFFCLTLPVRIWRRQRRRWRKKAAYPARRLLRTQPSIQKRWRQTRSARRRYRTLQSDWMKTLSRKRKMYVPDLLRRRQTWSRITMRSTGRSKSQSTTSDYPGELI